MRFAESCRLSWQMSKYLDAEVTWDEVLQSLRPSDWQEETRLETFLDAPAPWSALVKLPPKGRVIWARTIFGEPNAWRAG